MYYFQVEEFQRSTHIYQFGRHYLTRAQLEMIVNCYLQQIKELEKFNTSYYPEFIGMEEAYCWDNLRADFENGHNINNSKWKQPELMLLRIIIKRQINLHTPKPKQMALKTKYSTN